MSQRVNDCRRLYSALIVVMLATLACTTNQPAGSQPPGSSGTSAAPGTRAVTLILNFLPVAEHAPMYLALENGYWADAGLTVDIQRDFGSGDTVTKIGTKQAQFGIADLSAVILARATDDIAIRAVASYYATSPAAIMFRESSGIETPADLEGKSVVTTASSILNLLWPVFTERAGIDADQVEVLIADPAAKNAVFVQGQSDTLLEFLPVKPVVESQAGEALGHFTYSDVAGLDFYGLSLITHDDTIASDPELVRSFTLGLLRGVEAALADPATAVAALKKHVPTTDEALALESWEIEPDIIVIDETRENGLGYISEARVAETIEVADLSTEEDVDVVPSEVYTDDFLPESPLMPPG